MWPTSASTKMSFELWPYLSGALDQSKRPHLPIPPLLFTIIPAASASVVDVEMLCLSGVLIFNRGVDFVFQGSPCNNILHLTLRQYLEEHEMGNEELPVPWEMACHQWRTRSIVYSSHARIPMMWYYWGPP